jgi:hypothetical protein
MFERLYTHPTTLVLHRTGPLAAALKPGGTRVLRAFAVGSLAWHPCKISPPPCRRPGGSLPPLKPASLSLLPGN